MQYIIANTIFGVLTNIKEYGIWLVNLEISINNSNTIFNAKNSILEIGCRIKDINTDIKPKTIIIPKSGLASKLDIKNVKEIVLKFNTVIGIIISCAENVILKIFAIFSFIFNFINKFVIFLLNTIIPIVPINDSFKPISFMANGF